MIEIKKKLITLSLVTHGPMAMPIHNVYYIYIFKGANHTLSPGKIFARMLLIFNQTLFHRFAVMLSLTLVLGPCGPQGPKVKSLALALRLMQVLAK